MHFDIIGDIHGYADALKSLLSRLGYDERGGAYVHPESQAIFLGDFVDRGPAIRDSLAIVRRMVAAGSARAVMGNHEYNSICFHTIKRDESHRWLRSRNDRHIHQHLETLYQFRHHQNEWRDHLAWFSTLPLFLDLRRLRIVHAAWHAESLALLRHYSDAGTLTEELLRLATIRGNKEFDAIQNVLKGVEIHLPRDEVFVDKEGVERSQIRVRWWDPAPGKNYRSIAVSPSPEIMAESLAPEDGARLAGYSDEIPVFFGHYWLEDATPVILSPYVACLDFSVANGGYLAAYRWKGEGELTNEHYVVSG